MQTEPASPRSFADVIGCWETAEQLGADIGEPGVNVRAWRNRNSLPPEHWTKLVDAATQRGFAAITYALLAQIAAAGGTLPNEPPAREPRKAGTA
jgi:hypothetical protein